MVHDEKQLWPAKGFQGPTLRTVQWWLVMQLVAEPTGSPFSTFATDIVDLGKEKRFCDLAT